MMSFIEAFARLGIYFATCSQNLAKRAISVVFSKLVSKLFFPNYRPVSILPCVTEFLTRIAYNRILSYLNDFHILGDDQYGFKENHSQLPLMHLLTCSYDKILSALDHKENPACWSR